MLLERIYYTFIRMSSIHCNKYRYKLSVFTLLLLQQIVNYMQVEDRRNLVIMLGK